MEDPEAALESHQSNIKVSDAGVQLLGGAEVLGDAPPVEDVGEEAGQQSGQSPQPSGLVSPSSAVSVGVRVGVDVSQAWPLTWSGCT